MTRHSFNEYDESDFIPVTEDEQPFGGSILSQLEKELSKPADIDPFITLKVPARPNLTLKFSTDLSLQQIERWRKASASGKKGSDFDVIRFNQIVIISQCRGILLNGVLAENEDGKPLTFRSQELLTMLNSLDSYAAVQTLYGRDAHILKAGDDILEAAGYGDKEDEDGEVIDPLI